jgi:hypothetical protein
MSLARINRFFTLCLILQKVIRSYTLAGKEKITAFITLFSHNREAIVRDLKLLFNSLRYIGNIFFPLNSDPSVRSELKPSSYNGLRDMFTTVIQALLPYKRQSASAGTLVFRPDAPYKADHNSKWFFINGIATSPPVAALNTKQVATIFNRPVHLLHTPTYGIVWDLWQSVRARTLKTDAGLSQPAYEAIKNALEAHDRVVVVAHSQGTIITAYIVSELLKDKDTRQLAHKLEIYSFACAADSLATDRGLSERYKRTVPYVEHFANGKDIVSNLGVLSNRQKTDGELYVANEKKGHLFNDHYIGGVARGDYCHGLSRLSKYVGGSTPANTDYARA